LKKKKLFFTTIEKYVFQFPTKPLISKASEVGYVPSTPLHSLLHVKNISILICHVAKLEVVSDGIKYAQVAKLSPEEAILLYY